MDNTRTQHIFGILSRTTLLLETALIVFVVLSLISLTVAQIILRNFFDTGFLWGDHLVRILVLWVALLGAMFATRSGQHIKIDVASRLLPEHLHRHVERLNALFASLVCATAAYFSFQFVYMEYQDGEQAFANIPVWLCEAIIPFAFAVMAWRFFLTIFTQQHKARI